MRATVGRFVVLAFAAAGCLVAGPRARADEQTVLERIDAVLAAVARVEERLAALDQRLGRLETRLADVEAFVQRLDERAPPPAEADAAAPAPEAAGGVEVVDVAVRNRRFVRLPDTGDEYLVFDVEAVVHNLERAGRIRARLHLTDRFGASKRSMAWTSSLLRRGDRIVERDVRLRITRNAPEDIWLRTTDPREIRARFDVVEVLYGLDRHEEPVPEGR
jgi:hypothetical protein